MGGSMVLLWRQHVLYITTRYFEVTQVHCREASSTSDATEWIAPTIPSARMLPKQTRSRIKSNQPNALALTAKANLQRDPVQLVWYCLICNAEWGFLGLTSLRSQATNRLRCQARDWHRPINPRRRLQSSAGDYPRMRRPGFRTLQGNTSLVSFNALWLCPPAMLRQRS